MSTEETKTHYFTLGKSDGKKKAYPLWSTLVLAQETVAANAYLDGFRNATGVNLKFFRDGQKR